MLTVNKQTVRNKEIIQNKKKPKKGVNCELKILNRRENLTVLVEASQTIFLNDFIKPEIPTPCRWKICMP